MGLTRKPTEGDSTGVGTPVFPKIVKDLEERTALGVKKYNQPLTTLNGRLAFQDMYEELIDAVQYTAQIIIESNELPHIWVAIDLETKKFVTVNEDSPLVCYSPGRLISILNERADTKRNKKRYQILELHLLPSRKFSIEDIESKFMSGEEDVHTK